MMFSIVELPAVISAAIPPTFRSLASFEQKAIVPASVKLLILQVPILANSPLYVCVAIAPVKLLVLTPVSPKSTPVEAGDVPL